MARILNLIIVILGVIGLSIVLRKAPLRKTLIFYTQLSNLLNLITSALLVILGERNWVMVLRYLSVCMLVMTFLVTAFILVPMSGKLKELLFSGNGLYHHFLIPILSTFSYLVVEKKAPFSWVWLPVVVTLIYGIVMVILNYKGRVEGPYPFFNFRQLGIFKTIIWLAVLLLVISTIAVLVGI